MKSLGPKEVFTLQLLSYLQVPTLLNVRSKAGPAERIPIQIQRLYPTWFNILAAVTFMVGLGFSAYWLVKVVVYLSKSIGIA